jgi:hypothetical protein
MKKKPGNGKIDENGKNGVETGILKVAVQTPITLKGLRAVLAQQTL